MDLQISGLWRLVLEERLSIEEEAYDEDCKKYYRVVGKPLIPICSDNNIELPSSRQIKFGHTYWSSELNDGKDRGGKPYYCPVGWKRYSFYITETPQDFYQKFKGWCICYHGIKFQYGLTILLSGLKPANQAAHGAGVYFSPCINYAYHPRYSDVQQMPSEYQKDFSKSGRYLQFVLECRVHPGNIKKMAKETLSANSTTVDPNINNSVIEWVVDHGGKQIEISTLESNLSNVDECALNKYCRTILPKIHHYIKAIKVDDENIDSGFPLWLYSKIYPNLESLFITKIEKDVRCFDNVYVLLNNLPSIESVNIDIPNINRRRGQEPQQQNDVQFDYDKNIPSTLSKLKHFVFYAMFTANYDYLELLLSQCCFNLEYLSLNLYIDQFVDGERLEKKLLSKLTKLKVFHFCLRIPVVGNTLNIDDYIQTYKSSYWINNNHSILCFNQPLRSRYYCVFSLPFMFNKFCYVSNDLVNYRSNDNNDILLYSKRNKAKQITLYDNTVPYRLELFQIIQKAFPRATDLVFLTPHIPCLSDNLLNNEFMMENIVTLILLFEQVKFKHFRRLLLMTPNIQQLYILQSLVFDILRNSEDSSFEQVQSTCNRIRRVYIARRSFQHDVSNDNGIKLLFPNAEPSVLR
ncbi:unnamed protein product [Didymodactylos carnosus]|uniref:Uncharacterized protein n=1 Tax=Didymodactylos carnosus TaxID=1234261 RepID=A0A814DEG9_9BILA|nr:unnamed protein product [Didymodactylos carnosus]CAF3728617.1 unnamed protein product [Didymodactylos carnosus]